MGKRTLWKRIVSMAFFFFCGSVRQICAFIVGEYEKMNSKHRKCSHTSGKPARPCPCGPWPVACWGKPQTLFRKDGEMNGKPNTKHCAARPCDAGRTGLDPAEMAQLHTKNFSAYARKMLIDGYIVHMDTSDIRRRPPSCKRSASMSIRLPGVSTSTGTVYAQDIEDIKGALAKIWQLQRYILSSQR